MSKQESQARRELIAKLARAARVIGEIAFSAGVNRPHDDKTMIALVESHNDHGVRAAAFAAWTAGWSDANFAKVEADLAA